MTGAGSAPGRSSDYPRSELTIMGPLVAARSRPKGTAAGRSLGKAPDSRPGEPARTRCWLGSSHGTRVPIAASTWRVFGHMARPPTFYWPTGWENYTSNSRPARGGLIDGPLTHRKWWKYGFCQQLGWPVRCPRLCRGRTGNHRLPRTRANRVRLPPTTRRATLSSMYVVTEADAAAIREVYERDGELSAAMVRPCR